MGVGCGLLVDAIDLAGGSCLAGLPSFNQSFFFNPFFVANNTCVGQPTTFEMQTSRTISSVVWDFGEGNSSTDISPTHTYVAPGIYTVLGISKSNSLKSLLYLEYMKKYCFSEL